MCMIALYHTNFCSRQCMFTLVITAEDDRSLRSNQPSANGLATLHGRPLTSANSNCSQLTDVEAIEHDPVIVSANGEYVSCEYPSMKWTVLNFMG